MKFRSIKIYLFISVLSALFYSRLDAQIERNSDVDITLPEVALVDIEPNTGSITLAIQAPSEAGNPPAASSNTSKWINYTSAIAPTTSSRAIQVQITNGSVPAGLNLRVLAYADAGGGGGTMGTSSGQVTLTGAPNTIVSNIQGCYTGDGSGNGHQLMYSIVVTDYSLLDYTGSGGTVEVTYTIIDN